MDQLFALGNVPDWNEIFEITVNRPQEGAQLVSKAEWRRALQILHLGDLATRRLALAA